MSGLPRDEAREEEARRFVDFPRGQYVYEADLKTLATTNARVEWTTEQRIVRYLLAREEAERERREHYQGAWLAERERAEQVAQCYEDAINRGHPGMVADNIIAAARAALPGKEIDPWSSEQPANWKDGEAPQPLTSDEREA